VAEEKVAFILAALSADEGGAIAEIGVVKPYSDVVHGRFGDPWAEVEREAGIR
jgi:hypothetical protein